MFDAATEAETLMRTGPAVLAAGQLQSAEAAFRTALHADFAATARLVGGLDLVITVDRDGQTGLDPAAQRTGLAIDDAKDRQFLVSHRPPVPDASAPGRKRGRRRSGAIGTGLHWCAVSAWPCGA